MRQSLILLCSVFVFGALTISSSSSSVNYELYLGFLSYDDNSHGSERSPCCEADKNDCSVPCGLVFDVVLQDRNGIEIGARQKLATALSTQPTNQRRTRYVDADDVTKPVLFHVPDQTVDVRLFIRVHTNITSGNDVTGMDRSPKETTDELAHILAVKGSSDFFYTMVIHGDRRPNAALHLAVRFSCKGGNCLTDCVDKPGLQPCKKSSTQNYIENPLARCPHSGVHPTANPTPSTTTMATPTTSSPTSQQTQKTQTSSSSTTTTTSAPTTQSASSSAVTKTQIESSTASQMDTSTQVQSTQSSSPITTVSPTPTINPTKIVSQSTHTTTTSSGSDLSSVETFLQSTINPTRHATDHPSTTMTYSYLHTSSIILEPSISTTTSHKSQSSTVQSETMSSSNLQPTSTQTISSTSKRRSCSCTKSRTSKSVTSSITDVESTKTQTSTASITPTPSSTYYNTHQTLSTVHTLDPTQTSTITTGHHSSTTGTTQPHLTSTTKTSFYPTTSTTNPSLHLSTSTTKPSLQPTTTPPPHPSTSRTTPTSTPTPTNPDIPKDTTSSTDPISPDVSSETTSPPSTSTHTTQPPFLPVASSEDDDDAMAYWAIIVGSVLGGLALVGLIGYFLYRSRQTSLRKHQELYTVTPQMISTIEENGTAGRSDVPMTTALL